MSSRSVHEGPAWEHRPIALEDLDDSSGRAGDAGESDSNYGNWRRTEVPPEAFSWRREDSSPRNAGVRSIGWVRMAIALSFVACFGLVLCLGFLATGTGHWQNSGEWFQAALPATVSLLGSAIGFYYGEKRNDR